MQRALPWIDAQPDPLWRYLAGVAEYDLLLRLHPDRVAALEAAVARVQDHLQAAWPPLARRPLLRVQQALLPPDKLAATDEDRVTIFWRVSPTP